MSRFMAHLLGLAFVIIASIQLVHSQGYRPIVTVDRPAGVGVDRYGNIYVPIDREFKVMKLSRNGTIMQNFTDPQMNNPYGIAIDMDLNVYVPVQTSELGSFIIKFAANGARMPMAAIPGGRDSPLGSIVVDNNNFLYVVDRTNNRAIKMTGNGTQIAVIGNSTTIYNPTGIAIDRNGSVYLSYFWEGAVKFSSSGQRLQFYPREGNPLNLVVDSLGNLYITGTPAISKISADGTRRTDFRFPGDYLAQHIAIDANDTIYVTVVESSGSGVGRMVVALTETAFNSVSSASSSTASNHATGSFSSSINDEVIVGDPTTSRTSRGRSSSSSSRTRPCQSSTGLSNPEEILGDICPVTPVSPADSISSSSSPRARPCQSSTGLANPDEILGDNICVSDPDDWNWTSSATGQLPAWTWIGVGIAMIMTTLL